MWYTYIHKALHYHSIEICTKGTWRFSWVFVRKPKREAKHFFAWKKFYWLCKQTWLWQQNNLRQLMLTCEKLKHSFWRMKKLFFRILEHFRPKVFSVILSVKFLNSVDPQRFEMQWKKTKSLVTVCLNSWFTPSPSFSRKRINVANDLFRQFAEINECSRTMACDSPFKLDFLIHWTSLVGLQGRHIQKQNRIGKLRQKNTK